MNLKRVKIFQHRELLILAIALGFLFFGWNAAEQHLTSFYQTTEGQATIALNSLAILYASTVIGSFAGPILIRKLGIKNSIVLGFLTYIFLVFGITTKIPLLILTLSALLGIGSGIIGIAQIDLVRIFSPKNSRGELIGSITALRTIGGGLGVLSVSLLLKFLKIEKVYFSLGILMTIGMLILLFIKAPEKSEAEEKEKIFKIIKKTLTMLKEPKLLLTIPLSMANGFLLGLVLGAIPVTITKAHGIEYVGLIMPLFHFNLALSGFYSGRLSDKVGRFPILYCSIVAGIGSAITIILSNKVFSTVLAMLLASFFAATSAVIIATLFIDLFDKKVKEAQAAAGIIGAILGIVPSFILNKYFSITQLLYLAIFLCLLGGLSLRILELKQQKI